MRFWPTKRFLKFSGAGAFSMALFYALLYLFTEIANLWYIASLIIASMANFISCFTLQKFWAFNNMKKNGWHLQAIKYGVMKLSLTFINIVLLYLIVESFHFWYMWAQIPITLGLTAVSYIITRQIFAN